MKLFFIILFLFQPLITNTQSTCPVIIQPNDVEVSQQQQQQRCKCGIKTDGHIYIYCARKFLKRVPKFMRSSILYDELILSGNSIETISNNSFQGIRVKHLFLDDNRIKNVEQGAFIELANYLEELVLDISFDTNSISFGQYQPPISIFDNLLNLKILKLNGFIHMFRVNSYLFNKTRKLETIYLSNCNLIEISTNAFNGIELSLRELNLNHNQLNNNDNLSKNLFKLIYNGYFKRLETLNLAYNHIQSLVDASDDDQIYNHDLVDPKLSLDLSFNEISHIDERLFNKLRFMLVKLNLNNNELKNENANFFGQELDFNRKSLNFIKNLQYLRELHLDYNHIKYLNKNLFKNLNKLEILSLKGNYIYELTSFEIFNGLGSNLKKLNLASNKLNSISDNVFKDLNKLKELSLEKNSLNNSLSATANIFNGLEDELKQLNLESNGLNNANLDTIRNLVNIEILKLGNNNISRLNSAIFRQFVNLTTVDLEYNSFKHLPIINNKTLTSLNLFHNKICYFDIDQVLGYYKALKNLNINSNLLECNCHLKNLRVWLEKNSVNSTIDMFMFQNLRCTGPSRLKGKLLLSLDVEDLICDDKDNNKCPTNDEFSIDLTTFTTKTTTEATTIANKTLNISTITRKRYIKSFHAFLTNENNFSLQWQVESDDRMDEDQKFQAKIRYFKLIINELYVPTNNDANTTILNSNMNLINSNIREYNLNSLSENKIYELCLLMIFEIQEYEKRCQIINTKLSSSVFSTPSIHTSNVLDYFYNQNNKLTAAANLNTPSTNINSSGMNFLKVETKQILFGSLIGAMIVIILILIIIYLFKINKTNLNEKRLLYEQQKQQLQQQQQKKNGNNLLMPVDYNTLTANIFDYGVSKSAHNQQILFIRPVATLPNNYSKTKKRKIPSLFSKCKSNNENKQIVQPPQSTSTQPFLLSDLSLFPSYVIKQKTEQKNINHHDSTASSSASSTTSTSSAFASFTPILSTTLETLANNSDVNNSNYQHMYHEITDTLLSSQSKYLLNGTNTTIITNLSPFMPIKINNAQQYMISSSDGYYENHAKEMFI